MPKVVVIVKYVAQPGKAAVALSSIQGLVGEVLANEPDCGGIDVLCAQAASEQITLIERWPDQDTFLGPHMQQPHIQRFITSAGNFLTGPPEISFHTHCGDT